VGWIRLSQCRIQLCPFTKTIMYLRLPQKQRISLLSEQIQFSVETFHTDLAHYFVHICICECILIVITVLCNF
jgi:hypothetical protein